MSSTSEPARTPIDWRKLFNSIVDKWWLILVVLGAVLVLMLWDRVTDMFDGPSGREVAAEARADVADAKQATSNAESEQIAAALARVEQAAARGEQLNRHLERVRDAIQNAPDLDSGIAEHDPYVAGVRRDAARERAAALSDYRSSIDP